MENSLKGLLLAAGTIITCIKTYWHNFLILQKLKKPDILYLKEYLAFLYILKHLTISS